MQGVLHMLVASQLQLHRRLLCRHFVGLLATVFGVSSLQAAFLFLGYSLSLCYIIFYGNKKSPVVINLQLCFDAGSTTHV